MKDWEIKDQIYNLIRQISEIRAEAIRSGNLKEIDEIIYWVNQYFDITLKLFVQVNKIRYQGGKDE